MTGVDVEISSSAKHASGFPILDPSLSPKAGKRESKHGAKAEN
jgi:hypothetical protein